ncbi:MAG: deoxyribonuclease HsdR, partial [Bacteroidota bacterium]|nr:deoxyribonuclease HsdR [Bacteroidota bacterium]
VSLRILFGALMFFSTIRFILKGWVQRFYIAPQFHFTFYCFDWVRPLSAEGMYLVFALMLITSLCICIGLFYRVATVIFFLCFTYVELIDITYYLNHYYLVSLIAFLLILVPANRFFSLDVRRKPSLAVTHVAAWTINIFKLQLILVYFFAGLSKLGNDWLLNALPLKMWLPAYAHLPIVGVLMTKEWVAHLFSWFGAFFDLTIWIFLLNKSTRPWAYLVVIVFHITTALLFKIGIFPYVMILLTVIFFSKDVHLSVIRWLGGNKSNNVDPVSTRWRLSSLQSRVMGAIVSCYFLLQFTLPLRYLLYPGNLLWTEQGFRFSWRVMLMEKVGTIFFYIKDADTGNETEINNAQYLTSMQEKMMATQPDMILQYAHFLKAEYIRKGVKNAIVTAKSYVTLNGSGSTPFIDPGVDLSREEESFLPKQWILPVPPKPAN